jgi:hypothetical protein
VARHATPDDKSFIAGNGMTGKKLLDRGKKLKLEVFDNIEFSKHPPSAVFGGVII